MAMCSNILLQSNALRRGYYTLWIKLQQANYIMQQQIKSLKMTCKAIVCPIGCEQQPLFIHAQTKPLFKTLVMTFFILHINFFFNSSFSTLS
jgi:hypothetical protein